MDAELTPEQEQLRAALRRWLAIARRIAHVRAQLGDRAGLRPRALARARAPGLTGLLLPERIGGAGAE